VPRLLLGPLHIAAVVDLFSRKVLVVQALARTPTAADVRALMLTAILCYGAANWLITDHGTQFVAKRLGRFLRRNRIHRRFGANGSSQSVAVIDRFWRSLKTEALGGFLGFRSLAWARRRLEVYQRWFNGERAHGGLGGATPNEVY
jgi:putative transposase